MSGPRVAIVSDALVQRGGAERVVEAMARAFPDAPIYALLYSAEHGPGSLRERVRPSWLQRAPLAATKHRYYLPFYASAIESFSLDAYDVIVSSHHSVAKGVLRNADQVHVSYCHTPMRALWERSAEELATLPVPVRPLAAAVLSRLRVWDYAAAARVDRFVANSRVTQKRIQKHYGRGSDVLFPPIDVARFTPAASEESGTYFLIASRNVPYKRVDVAVAAARLANVPLVVCGGEHPSATNVPGVTSLGIVDDVRLRELMRGARALLFPQIEDFGMTPLEMNACGRPTIAYGVGGALETVIDGVTGLLVPEQTPEAFAHAIAVFDTMRFAPDKLRAHAESFSQDAFVANLRAIIGEEWSARTRWK